MPHVYTIDGAVVLAQESAEPIESQEVTDLKSMVEKFKRERWYLALGSALGGLVTGLLVGTLAE